MTTGPSADEIRSQQRATWDKFSGGWTKWDALNARMLEPLSLAMIGSLGLQHDSRHLDLACGTGEPGLAIAAFAVEGHVVLTDLSPDMVSAASANAAARGLSNVEVKVCSADDLPFDDASFDSVSCRLGFMFIPDIPTAVGEIHRVLRTGGRLSATVWAGPPGNTWATVPMAAIQAEVDLPAPAPDAPGLYRCAAPGLISGMLSDAGFQNVEETDVFGALEPSSPEEYWSFISEVAAGVVAGLAAADDSGRVRIRDAVLEAAEAYVVDDQLSLPLHARCITGTK